MFIMLEDVNDEIPLFTEREQETVLEGEPIGTKVTQVNAIDKDGTFPNNRVSVTGHGPRVNARGFPSPLFFFLFDRVIDFAAISDVRKVMKITFQESQPRWKSIRYHLEAPSPYLYKQKQSYFSVPQTKNLKQTFANCLIIVYLVSRSTIQLVSLPCPHVRLSSQPPMTNKRVPSTITDRICFWKNSTPVGKITV